MELRKPQNAPTFAPTHRSDPSPPGGDGNSCRAELPGGRDSTRLECYSDRVFTLMTVLEAHRMIWEVDFAWVLPTDWYRFAWGGYTGDGRVVPVAEPSGAEFGFYLLTKQDPLTDSDMKHCYPRVGLARSQPLVARASRFKRLFPKKLRQSDALFVHRKILDGNGVWQPRYEVCSGRTTLLITGIDADASPETPPVNWPAFQSRPGSCGATAITVPDVAK